MDAGSARGVSTQQHEQELVITRILNAPIDLVYTAWTQPTHLARWWGPLDSRIRCVK